MQLLQEGGRRAVVERTELINMLLKVHTHDLYYSGN